MKGQLWLNSSLFCNRNNWGKLLNEGISPFAKKAMADETVAAYSIELSYFEGDNVRFAILVEERSTPLVGEVMDCYFKNFFEYAGFDSPDVSLPINGLFLPFPCNSIRYGLYNVFTRPQEHAFIDIQRELSDVISLVLSEETADEELLITLGFYLQSIWMVRKQENILFNDNNVILLLNNKTDEGKRLQAEIHERYLLIREMLEEIYQIVRKADDLSCNDCPGWLRQWSMACDSYLRNVNYNNTDIPAMISRHLGLTPIMNFMVFYFLQQIMAVKR